VPIKSHKCTDKDWANFPKAEPTQQKQIDALQKSGFMYCMAEKDLKGKSWRENTLYGTMETESRSLKIQALHCRPKGKDFRKIHNNYQENISW